MSDKYVRIYGNTDIGKKRANNEDAFLAQKIWDDDHWLTVVIDGVGGHEGGEVAAEIAQATILKYLQEFPDGERLSLLKEAVTQANNSIFEARGQRKGCAEMSCVLTACLFELPEMRLNMVHVGDTRLYCHTGKSLQKLSHDHSFIGYYEENGTISEEEAMNHPQRNIVNRVVGDAIHSVDDEKFIEAQTFPLIPDSAYLLCSDGLYDMLTSAEIASVLDKEISTEDKVNGLIDFANQKGGKDNITVVLLQVEDDKTAVTDTVVIDDIPETTRQLDVSSKRYKIIQIIILILVCLIASVATAWLLHLIL